MNCEICGKEAEINLSPDPDIKGLDACADHLVQIKELYQILMFLGEEEYQHCLESMRNASAKPPKKRKK